MQDTSKVEFGEILSLPHCFEHSHCYKETANPKECVDCEISSRYECHDSRCRKNVQAFNPVFDVIKAEPLVVAEDDPEDGEYSGSI